MLKKLHFELPNQVYDYMQPYTTRLEKYPELFKSTICEYKNLNKNEKFLADLFSTNRILKFYAEFEDKTFDFELHVENSIESILHISKENYTYNQCDNFILQKKSTSIYYEYHKLSQFKYSDFYALCRVEEYNIEGQKKPIILYIPLEFNNLNVTYYNSIHPEILFNNNNDNKIYNIFNCNEDIYYPGELYIPLTSFITSEELKLIEENRFNKKIDKSYYIINKGLYLLQLFETYLPYLLLSFIKIDLIEDIKLRILDKLNFSNRDNILRILQYKDNKDIRRILPYLIEDMDNRI